MLTASCVLYNPDKKMLAQTLDSLDAAVRVLNTDNAGHLLPPLYMINNADTEFSDYYDFKQLSNCRVVARSKHGNVGYGAGHNIAIKEVESKYHLVINPDVILHEDSLLNAIQYMDDNPDVALLSPFSTDPQTGQLQYLCKKFPSIAVLALRFIDNTVLNNLFRTILARYEERQCIMANELFDAEIVSGCFMLYRTDVLKRLGGFDERYFLYFEDFDLSIRTGQLGKIVCHPGVRIMHHGGGAGRKGREHFHLFMRSAKLFFDQYGWRWF
ncbi:glycosyltransferase family 2 protein [Alkalimarinus alittae]|uniref:Glycosyltransferase family 2 protein n=1 Tax=Alkalimarinus alittae TaxID=2961619 RepID=A0ABY6MZC5_9ALTE|nr:glycosyltransferase family 2 protein [Alkalimarinus alittae]UZE95122.1 glycosyltransferase family 2 protein [Alkalimarinus alittae]